MSQVTLVVADVEVKYSEVITQFNITDELVEIAIQDAYVELTGLINHDESLTASFVIDDAKYGNLRIKTWWRELAYYYLFARGEQERIAQDKRDFVLSQIETFHKKETFDDTDYPDGYIITASDEILPEADILEWGS